jgi:hypothetical protein
MSFRSLKTCALAAVLSVGSVLVVATPAHAQFGAQAGFADSFRPEFLDRDMPLFVEILKLEDWQRPIVEVLLQDYMISFDSGVENVKNKMRALQGRIGNARPDTVMELILEPLAAWDAERAALGVLFLNNIKAQLTSGQISRWPRFERTLRREKELPKGELMGESVDLYTLIRTMRFPFEVEESLDPVLVEYELSLDAALSVRAAKIASLQDEIKDAMAGMNFEAGLRATDQIMSTRVGVRRVQDDHIEKISASLPSEFGKQFRHAALLNGYPRAFRPTPIPRLIESIRSLPDLSDSQIAQLDDIEADFKLRLDNLEMRIVDAYRIHQPSESREKVQRMIDRRNGKVIDRVTSLADRLIAEKNDLVDETRRRILAILSPEQTGSIPGNSSKVNRIPGIDGIELDENGIAKEKTRTLAPGKKNVSRPTFKSPGEASKERGGSDGSRSLDPTGSGKGGKRGDRD